MIYWFSEGARAEHLEQVAYYEQQRAGLGERFLRAFDAAMARACAYPDRFPVESDPDIRRIRIPGFPLKVFYRVRDAEVEVLALAHDSRRPGFWAGRI